jgi:uncharacterized membrane protein
MKRFRDFLKTTTIGGITVILPSVLLIVLFRWLFRWLTALIGPLSDQVIARAHLHELFAHGFVVFVILALCFIVGLIVRTKVGRFLQDNLEEHILSIAPGYRIIRETVMQLLGRKRNPFITDEHDGGWVTVFVPTGPNPTTGYILHLPLERVTPITVRVDTTIRSVIACGAGSTPLLTAYRQALSKTAA